MLPDRVSNPGPLTYESGALPIALRGPAVDMVSTFHVTENLSFLIKYDIIIRCFLPPLNPILPQY